MKSYLYEETIPPYPSLKRLLNPGVLISKISAVPLGQPCGLIVNPIRRLTTVAQKDDHALPYSALLAWIRSEACDLIVEVGCKLDTATGKCARNEDAVSGEADAGAEVSVITSGQKEFLYR